MSVRERRCPICGERTLLGVTEKKRGTAYLHLVRTEGVFQITDTCFDVRMPPNEKPHPLVRAIRKVRSFI